MAALSSISGAGVHFKVSAGSPPLSTTRETELISGFSASRVSSLPPGWLKRLPLYFPFLFPWPGVPGTLLDLGLRVRGERWAGCAELGE